MEVLFTMATIATGVRIATPSSAVVVVIIIPGSFVFILIKTVVVTILLSAGIFVVVVVGMIFVRACVVFLADDVNGANADKSNEPNAIRLAW